MEFQKWIGKYLAEVTDVTDPEKAGRVRGILLHYKDLGEMGWALPSVPLVATEVTYPYPNEGEKRVLKADKPDVQVGDLVWMEFLYGDLDHPLVSGYVPRDAKDYVSRVYLAMEEEE